MIWYASLWTRLSSRNLVHGTKGGDSYDATVGDNPTSSSTEGGVRPSFGAAFRLFEGAFPLLRESLTSRTRRFLVLKARFSVGKESASALFATLKTCAQREINEQEFREKYGKLYAIKINNIRR